MKEELITSKNNEFVKYLSALADKRFREREGSFVMEGFRAVSEAADAGRIQKMIVSQSFYASADYRKLRGSAAPVVILADNLFQKFSDTQTPQGVAAVCRTKKYDLSRLLHEERRILLLENVRDPGNMGTVIRTAAAAGFGGIIASDGCVDFYNPKVLRSTVGCIFKIKTISCKGDLLEISEEARNTGFRLYAAHPRGGKDLHQMHFADKAGIVIGNEANGLTAAQLRKCDELITIKMAAGVESLNASVAAALMMYETIRNQ